MISTIELKIIVATEDDLRRIIREEIARSQTQVVVKVAIDPSGDPPGVVTFTPINGGPAQEFKTVREGQPRPGYRFAADGQGGFREEPIPSFDPQGEGA